MPLLSRPWIILLVLGLFTASGLEAQRPDYDARQGLASFDTAWAVVHRAHYDTTFNGVDWMGVREELRPRAARATSLQELRETIQEMVGRLGRSHFVVIPAAAYGVLEESAAGQEMVEMAASEAESEALEEVRPGGAGAAGMKVRLVGGELLVTDVTEGGAAAAAGVRSGWKVEAIGPQSTKDLLDALAQLPPEADPRTRQLYAQLAVAPRLIGPTGSRLRVRFVDGEGRALERELVRRPARGEEIALPGLPPQQAVVEHRRIAREGVEVGVIHFDLWSPLLARRIDLAVDELRDTDGIVLDLRGNPGGAAWMPRGVAGHFLDEKVSLGTLKLRDSELHLRVNPRRVDTRGQPVSPYAGPVAILTDALTASASELFAAGMQGLGRARVFGETSAGQALAATMHRLPNGDVLMYANVDLLGPTGVRMEGRGVVPDEPVAPTREQLLTGEDSALEAALRWIARTSRE